MADTPNYVADPTLWERAKRKVYGKSRSVDIYANTKIADEYERLGGRYRGSKPGKGRGIEKWFAERWVNLKDRKGGSFGPCGRKTAKPEDYATYLDFIDTYPKCVPSDKALAMTEAEREFAILNKDVALLRVKWLPGDPPASASTTPPKGSDIKAEVRRLREERKRLVAKVKREGVTWPPSRTASGPPALPTVLFHSTPIDNLPAIQQHGLRPATTVPPNPGDVIHTNRVFLSRFDDPLFMNLPSDKLEGELVVLAVDTSVLDLNKLHPDDALYAGWAQEQLTEDETRKILMARGYDAEGLEGEQLDELALQAEAEIGDVLHGMWYATVSPAFFGGISSYYSELGEVAYEGTIPPDGISIHRRWSPKGTTVGVEAEGPQRIDWETYMRSRLPDPGLEHGALRATAQMSRRALRQHQARQREQFNVFFRDYDKVRAEYLQKIEAREIIDPSGSHYPSDETLDERITRIERMIEQMENAADFYEGEGLHDKARANRNVAARRRKAVERWKRERESQTPAAKESGIRRAKGKRPRGKGKRTVSGVGGRSPSGSITPVLERVTQKISDQMRREGWRDDERQKRYDEPTVWDINNGYCEDWAMAVEDEVEGAVMYWIEDLAPGDLGLSPVVVDKIASKAPSHAVIVYKGRFYDAQTPEGVESPLDLPLMRGVPRTYYVEGLRRAKGKRPKKGTTSGTVGFPKEVIEIKIPERDFLSMDPRSREYQENKAAQKRDLVDLAQALKNSAWTPGAERPSGVEVTTGKKSRSWIIAPLSTGEEGFRVGRWDPMGPSGHSDYKALGYGRDQDPADSESVWRNIALEELFYSGEYGREVDGEVEEPDVMIFRFLTPKRSLVDWWIQQPLGQWGMQVVQARGEGNRLRFEGKYEEAAEYERQHMPPGPVPDPTPIPDTIGGAKVTQRSPGDGGHPVLSYTLTFAAEPYAKQRGVSKVARSPRGFMRAFEEAGSWENLSEWWKNRRNNFVARHMAQVEKRGEALWTKKGEPSRRHLALVMWAYTPDPKRFKEWLDGKLEERGRLLGGRTIGGSRIEIEVAVHEIAEDLQSVDFYSAVHPEDYLTMYVGDGDSLATFMGSDDYDFLSGAGTTAYIDIVEVGSSRQGKGIGTALLERALAWVDAQAVDSQYLLPTQSDWETRKWYSQYGFRSFSHRGLPVMLRSGSAVVAGVTANETASQIWYHGSPRRFDNFRTEVRHTFGDGPAETALFFTPDPDFAKLYAQGPGGIIYRVSLRYRKPFDGRKLITSDQYWPPPREDLTREGQALYDALSEGLFGPISEDEWHGVFGDSQGLFASILRGDYDVMESRQMQQWLRSNGYDAFYVTGDGPRNIAVFDPHQVTVLESRSTVGGSLSQDLGTTSIDEGGVRFETGVPVRFRFLHNTDSSAFFNTEFQQHLEPGGYYLLHDESGTGPFVRGWLGGVAEAQSPLVLWHNTEQTIGYDEHSWKARLFDKFGSGSGKPVGQKAARRRNEKLRLALLEAGYDAVVTVRRGDEPSTLEIVLLDPENQIVEVGDPVK